MAAGEPPGGKKSRGGLRLFADRCSSMARDYLWHGRDADHENRWSALLAAPRGTGSTYTRRVDWESARRPIDLVASAMVFHLREIAGATVDSEKLRQQTDWLLKYLESAVWGKAAASGG